MALNNFMRIQTPMKISLMRVNEQSPKFCATRDCKNLCCVSVMLLYKFHPVIKNFVCRLPLVQVFFIYRDEKNSGHIFKKKKKKKENFRQCWTRISFAKTVPQIYNPCFPTLIQCPLAPQIPVYSWNAKLSVTWRLSGHSGAIWRWVQL
jgi:hypothetical protein